MNKIKMLIGNKDSIRIRSDTEFMIGSHCDMRLLDTVYCPDIELTFSRFANFLVHFRIAKDTHRCGKVSTL